MLAGRRVLVNVRGCAGRQYWFKRLPPAFAR
jgi:hypothetical protein